MAEAYRELFSDAERCSYSKNYREDVGLQTAMARATQLRALHAALMNGDGGTNPSRFLQDSSSSPAGYYYSTHVRQSSARDYPVFNPSYETEPLHDHKQILSENPIYKETWENHEQKKSDDEVFQSVNFEPHMTTTRHHNTKSRKNSSSDVTTSAASCNKHEPTNVTVSDYKPTHRRHMSLSWLFMGLKKKKKTNKTNNESTESLKKSLTEALRIRDAALNQAAEMRSSVLELSEKLAHLEAHCNELKNALAREKSREITIDPPKHEAMAEELLRAVSESRLSGKHFCNALLQQAQGQDLSSLLQPYNLSSTSKHRKTLMYHVEAAVNRILFENFENPGFRKGGSLQYLDPREDRARKYESFTELKGLNWELGNDFEFRGFCDSKMGDVVAGLGSSVARPWGEELVGAFYGSAKWVWLVHLLAFSFEPALVIMRVDEGRVFDGRYMEDVFEGRRKSSDEHRRVKAMVMPGFYVGDRVVRCKVLCRYKSVGS